MQAYQYILNFSYFAIDENYIAIITDIVFFA